MIPPAKESTLDNKILIGMLTGAVTRSRRLLKSQQAPWLILVPVVMAEPPMSGKSASSRPWDQTRSGRHRQHVEAARITRVGVKMRRRVLAEHADAGASGPRSFPGLVVVRAPLRPLFVKHAPFILLYPT